MMKREELSRIASVKFQKALSDRARAVTPRVLAFCVMAVSLVFTLAVTAANLRLTYVTDSDGARQLVVSSETDPARVMSLSGIEAEEGDHVYYTAFSGNLATLNIERAFTVNIQADGREYPVKMAFGTVAEALERAGITLEADDYTEPALDQLVTAGFTYVRFQNNDHGLAPPKNKGGTGNLCRPKNLGFLVFCASQIALTMES